MRSTDALRTLGACSRLTAVHRIDNSKFGMCRLHTTASGTIAELSNLGLLVSLGERVCRNHLDGP
eukprot:1060039-Amphidinium_carterae.1